ncbi:hypothetical protein GCM10027071_29940 [Microbacterium marinum]
MSERDAAAELIMRFTVCAERGWVSIVDNTRASAYHGADRPASGPRVKMSDLSSDRAFRVVEMRAGMSEALTRMRV